MVPNRYQIVGIFSYKSRGFCDYENKNKEGSHYEIQNIRTFKLTRGKIEEYYFWPNIYILFLAKNIFDQIIKHKGKWGNNNVK